MSQLQLKDKKVLVTGAGQGIGRAMVDAFIGAGAKVALNDLCITDTVQKALDETGALSVMGNVANYDDMKKVIQKVEEELGGVDVFVANAAGMTMVPFIEQEEDAWWDQVNTNLTGHIGSIQLLLPGMIKRGGGTIILLSSYFGIVGWKNASGYAASKSALIGFGQHLARKYTDKNINVGIILPGIIKTPQLNIDAVDMGITLAEVHEHYAKDIPYGRLGEPSEVAELALFMAGEGKHALNGRFVQVNGADYRGTPYYID